MDVPLIFFQDFLLKGQAGPVSCTCNSLLKASSGQSPLRVKLEYKYPSNFPAQRGQF